MMLKTGTKWGRVGQLITAGGSPKIKEIGDFQQTTFCDIWVQSGDYGDEDGDDGDGDDDDDNDDSYIGADEMTMMVVVMKRDFQ